MSHPAIVNNSETAAATEPGQPSPAEEIASLKQQLMQAQKMTALGELVGTTTHEFNNLLMTILNYAKMGLRHKDDPTREKAFTKILSASERAAKITNNILGMARNRSDEFEPTDMKNLIEDSLLLLEREMNKYRVRIDKQIEQVPEALARGNQIQQVLMNLLTNARQAMPSGGEIILRLTHDAATNTVDLMVRDNGSGIPQDKLRNIFDPYFSTKAGPDATGKGGTGLGLTACRDIIQAHNGRIRVDSTVGKGTAFTIKLPVAVATVSAPGKSVVPPINAIADSSQKRVSA